MNFLTTIVGELKRDLPEILETRFRVDLDDWDKPIIGMGCGLALFSRYDRVLNADGSLMSVHDALQAIWEEINMYLKIAETAIDKNL